MTSHRRPKHNLPLLLRFIVECEQRIVKQKQIIAELKSAKRSTGSAEETLRQHGVTLKMFRSHSEIMKVLV